jgi:hypothetical protein
VALAARVASKAVAMHKRVKREHERCASVDAPAIERANHRAAPSISGTSVSRSSEEHHVLHIDAKAARRKGCEKPRTQHAARRRLSGSALKTHIASRASSASQETRNTNEAASFRSRTKAHASLQQRSFDRASRFIDTRFDRLATRDLHTLMNKVLYRGRNANRKQDFS